MFIIHITELLTIKDKQLNVKVNKIKTKVVSFYKTYNSNILYKLNKKGPLAKT